MPPVPKDYSVYLPSRPSMRPSADAARRFAQLLRGLRASQAVIAIAEEVAKAASREEETKKTEQAEPEKKNS